MGPLNWYILPSSSMRFPPHCDQLTEFLVLRYKCGIRNIDYERDARIPADAIVINKPVLFIAGERDAVSRPEMVFQVAEDGYKNGYLPHVEVKSVAGAGHWIGLEKPQETFQILDQFARSL